MIVTSFWHPDGTPVSAQQFLEMTLGREERASQAKAEIHGRFSDKQQRFLSMEGPMKQRRISVVIGAALLVPLAACGHASSTGPMSGSLAALSLEEPWPSPGHSARRGATVLFYSDPLTVSVPTRARAGEPFVVGVTTYGGGCISEDTTTVRLEGQRADVVPYQRVYAPPLNGACTLQLRVTRREVHVAFPSPGVATVRVTGRASPGDSVVQVERAVIVQ